MTHDQIPPELEDWIDKTWPDTVIELEIGIPISRYRRRAARAAIQKLMPLVELMQWAQGEGCYCDGTPELVAKIRKGLIECGLSDEEE